MDPADGKRPLSEHQKTEEAAFRACPSNDILACDRSIVSDALIVVMPFHCLTQALCIFP